MFSFLQMMFGFLQRRSKPGPRVLPKIIYPVPELAKNAAAQRSPPCALCTEACVHTPPATENAPNTCQADEKIDVAVIAEQVSNALAPLLEQQKQELAAQSARQVAESQVAIENSLKAHDEKIEAELGRKLDKQVRVLRAQLERQIAECADRAAVAARKDAEGHWSNLKRELVESCSATAQRAAQRPIVDQLIALLDRVRDEESFLAAWYRKNPDLSLNLDCRQLQERYDETVRSFAAEILVILKSLGVEQIVGSAGPLDPQRQRVVAVEMTRRPELDGHVARIVRAGFLWGGTLYRPEQVIVYKQEQKK
jgi:molecular chaperone GrpE (heat shock protein)